MADFKISGAFDMIVLDLVADFSGALNTTEISHGPGWLRLHGWIQMATN